jgi:hypothetical protein
VRVSLRERDYWRDVAARELTNREPARNGEAGGGGGRGGGGAEVSEPGCGGWGIMEMIMGSGAGSDREKSLYGGAGGWGRAGKEGEVAGATRYRLVRTERYEAVGRELEVVWNLTRR